MSISSLAGRSLARCDDVVRDLLGIAESGYLCVCHDDAPYGASTPKMTIRLASTTPGQNGDFMPDAIATRWCPLARYVTMPPPVTCPISCCQRTWPLRVSNA